MDVAARPQPRIPRLAKAGAAAIGATAGIVGVLASLGLLGGGDDLPAALQPITVKASAPDAAPLLHRYEGPQFSLSYPRGWRIETRLGEESGSSATVLTPSADGILVRISVSPRSAAAQSLAAARARAATMKPGYRDLGLGVVTVAGQPGVRWDYLVRENGIELRRTEVVFTDARGNGYALVTQAPTASFTRWRNALDDVRESIVPTAR